MTQGGISKATVRGAIGLALCGAAILAAGAAPASAATFDVNDNTVGPGPAGANCAGADFTNIQGAINAAAASGDGINDTIRVCAGTYNEVITVTNAGLDLLGAQQGVDGRTRSVPTSDESRITGVGPSDGSLIISADDALVDGFLVEDAERVGAELGGVRTSTPVDGQQLINNIIRSNEVGIVLCNTGPDQALVRNNRVQSNNDGPDPGFGTGVLSTCGLNNALIEENSFSNHAINAIRVFSPGGSDVVVARNEFVGEEELIFADVSDLSIVENTITDAAADAVILAGDTDEVAIERNTFTGGERAIVRVDDFIASPNSNDDVTVTGNTMVGNPNETTDVGFLVSAASLEGPFDAHFNRVVGLEDGIDSSETDEIDAENNWWGCNEGPGQPGCETAIGDVDFTPWLVLGLTADPTTIPMGGSSQVSASLARNSASAIVGAEFPDATSVAFSSTLGTIGPSAATLGGVATTTLSAGTQSGTATISSALDNEAVSTVLVINPEATAPTTTKKKKCKKGKKKKKCKKGGKKKKG